MGASPQTTAGPKIDPGQDAPVKIADAFRDYLAAAKPRMAWKGCRNFADVAAIAGGESAEREKHAFGGIVVGYHTCKVATTPGSDYEFDTQVPLLWDGTGFAALARAYDMSLPPGALVTFRAKVHAYEYRHMATSPNEVWEPHAVDVAVIEPGDSEDPIDYQGGYGAGLVPGWVAVPPTSTMPTYRPPEYLAGSAGAALLYRGMRHLVSGPPEVGKTWLAAAAATQMLERRRVPVVWFDCDAVGQARIVERLVALGASADAIEDRFRFVRTPAAASQSDAAETVGAIAEQYAPGLVVWDGWNAALAVTRCGSDEEGVVLWRDAFLEPFHEARPGCASITTDHVARGARPSDIYSYGAQGKLAQVDVHLRVLQRRSQMFTRARAGEIAVSVMKDRPGGLDREGYRMPVAPEGEGVTWDVVVGAKMTGEERDARLAEAVIALLSERGPLATSVVEERVDGRRESIRDMLARLADDGLLAVEDGPRGARLWSVKGNEK